MSWRSACSLLGGTKPMSNQPNEITTLYLKERLFFSYTILISLFPSLETHLRYTSIHCSSPVTPCPCCAQFDWGSNCKLQEEVCPKSDKQRHLIICRSRFQNHSYQSLLKKPRLDMQHNLTGNVKGIPVEVFAFHSSDSSL